MMKKKCTFWLSAIVCFCSCCLLHAISKEESTEFLLAYKEHLESQRMAIARGPRSHGNIVRSFVLSTDIEAVWAKSEECAWLCGYTGDLSKGLLAALISLAMNLHEPSKEEQCEFYVAALLKAEREIARQARKQEQEAKEELFFPIDDIDDELLFTEEEKALAKMHSELLPEVKLCVMRCLKFWSNWAAQQRLRVGVNILQNRSANQQTF